ncbi:MAG TPA: hypothetical protein VIP31_06415 [Acidovorax sp.]
MIPSHITVAAIAALIAALATWFFQANHYEAKLLELRLQHADAVIRAAAQERIKQQAINTKYQEAINAATARASVLRRNADAARTESERLRAQLSDAARRIADAPPAAVAEYATAVNELFADCSRDYQELAEKADGHAADVRAITDAWPVTHSE